MVNLTCYIILLFKCKEKIIIIRGKKIVKVSQPYSFLRSPISKSLLLSWILHLIAKSCICTFFLGGGGGGWGAGAGVPLEFSQSGVR